MRMSDDADEDRGVIPVFPARASGNDLTGFTQQCRNTDSEIRKCLIGFTRLDR